jgi:hypothetical protein
MRTLASILFALMTLVLPTAGVTRNFCTISMAFVSESGECPMQGEDCCCEEGKHDYSPRPDCMIAAKPLPNADKSPVPHIPAADGAWILLPATLADFPPAAVAEIPPALGQRGPPVIPDPLYLTQRRLLI